MIKRNAFLLVLFVVVTGCASGPALEALPPTDTRHIEGRAVERIRLPDVPVPLAVPGGRAGPSATAPQFAIVVPPNTLYVCVVDRNGVRQQTAIEFAPKVALLCAKHPEMGPCQYERNACRRGGGRVFAANAKEITMQTEAEYDKKVLRVRFRGG